MQEAYNFWVYNAEARERRAVDELERAQREEEEEEGHWTQDAAGTFRLKRPWFHW